MSLQRALLTLLAFLSGLFSTLTSPCSSLPSSLAIFFSCSNNLLYPRENKADKKLVYGCQKCQYEQEAETSVVFKHEIIKSEK